MQAIKAESEALSTYTYRDGTVGVPVSELALAIFQRYPHRGWYGRTQGFVRGAVLPSLVYRGLCSLDRKLTPDGQDLRAQLKAELRLGWKQRGAQQALTNNLYALAPGPDLERAFTAIKRGVSSGWNSKYGGDELLGQHTSEVSIRPYSVRVNAYVAPVTAITANPTTTVTSSQAG